MRRAPRRAALAAAAMLACAGPRAAITREGGRTLLTYRGGADEVFLRGSMTSWRPVPVPRDGGAFALPLALAPGRYEYRLEIRRGGAIEVVLPDGEERAADGFGGENAILRVR